MRPGKRTYLRHACDLPLRARRDFNLHSPYDRWYHCLHHWFKTQFTIAKNEESYRFFRSEASFAREKIRHLRDPRYKYVMHPFSTFVIRKDIIMSFLWILLYLSDSITYFFEVAKVEGFYYIFIRICRMIIVIGNMIALFDTLTRFFVGYAIQKTEEVILDHKMIVFHYLKTYFFFDILVMVPYFIYPSVPHLTKEQMLLTFQLHRLRLVRLKMILDNFDKVMIFFRVTDSRRKISLLSITCLTVIHLCSCISGEIMFLVAMFDHEKGTSWLQDFSFNDNPFYLYSLHLGITVCHFFGAGTYHFTVQTTSYMFYYSIISMFGMIFYLYCLAEILQFFGMTNISETKYDEILKQVNDYMHQKEFSTKLKKKINAYYRHRYNQKFFSENKIMTSFTDHMRMEVLLYSCQNLIRDVQVFKGLSKAAIGTMVALLKQEIYMPFDKIKGNDDSGSVYFVLYGTCETRSEAGREVAHVEDGEHFGSVSGFEQMGETFRYSVYALEVTEVYKLEEADFEYCVKIHPEILYKMSNVMKASIRRFRTLVALREESDYATKEIIRNLRRGKVIHAGIKRIDLR